METRIIEFARLLREAGLKVSTAETMDSLRAVGLVGLERPHFYQALLSTLVKDPVDRPVFDVLFRLYFRAAPGTLTKANHKSIKRSVRQTSSHLYPMEIRASYSDGRGIGFAGIGQAAARLMETVARNEPSAIEALAQEAAERLGDIGTLEESCFAQNLNQRVDAALASAGWFEAMAFLNKHASKYSWIYRERLENFATLVRHKIEEELVRALGLNAMVQIGKAAALRYKPFGELNPSEAAEIQRKILKMAVKLGSKYSMKLRPASRGAMDMRRTLHKAARTRGVALKPAYRRRRRDKPELVLLCDVSGSVAQYSQFLLLLAYGVQRRFKLARCFLFVDMLDEVTHYFRNLDPATAIDTALAEARVSLTNNSDFGSVFFQFANDYLHELSPRTTLIVLGDAKNNGRPPERAYLKQISERVKRLIWLNPYPRHTWNTGDSIMGLYAPYCSLVHECSNLAHLEHLITLL